MPLHVSSTYVHRQEVKIVLYSLWYHHTYRCTGWERTHRTATYRVWWYQRLYTTIL